MTKIWAARSDILGGSVDIVKAFYETLSAEEKNTFDNKSENFRKELLKTELFEREYQERKLRKAFSRIIDCDYDFDRVYSLLKNDKTEKILEIQKLLLFEFKENYDKTENAINKWQEFINKKNFYEHKICCGCRFKYDEEWLEYNLKSDFMIKHFRQEKIIL